MMCVVGCILRMLGSPIILHVCMFYAGRESLFGNSPRFKGDSAQFFLEKRILCKLARDMSLCAGHILGWVMTYTYDLYVVA